MSKRTSQGGFTLLEMVISMSIISLVVLVMYQAFGAGTRIWNRQDVEGERLRRQDAVMRLIREDIRQLRPYSFRIDSKEGDFFAANGKTMFYVTTQGFGSALRTESSLFFTCLFAVPASMAATDPSLETPESPDSSDIGQNYSLYICKMDRPTTWLLEEIAIYNALSKTDQETYIPPESIRSRSVLLLSDISGPAFSFTKPDQGLEQKGGVWNQDDEAVADPLKTAYESSTSMEEDTLGAPEGPLNEQTKTWDEDEFPARVRFVYKDRRREHVIDAKPAWETETPEEEQEAQS